MENDPVIAPELRMPVPVAVLVGAGPGDPGLITVAGAAALADAAVVIYDALANPLLLSYCDANVELIYVGKRANEHTLTQEQINALLIQKCRDVLAKRTKRAGAVVRLKGGDPYVFGRGGEEGHALAQAGITFKVIPGITAGIAGPAYAGIPVTHRDFTSTVTFITGHQRDKQSGNERVADGGEEVVSVDYTALAKLGGTLVFYMGVKNLPELTQRLITSGLDASTPAAVVRMATHPEQQTVIGTVGTIAATAQDAEIKAPAITIIGKVVSVRDQLNWFETRPLFDQTVLVTRTRQQASELGGRLEFLGAKVIEAPTIEIVKPSDPAAAKQAIRDMHDYDCVVFTSANGVRTTWEAMEGLDLDARDFAGNIAAIGPGTADALIGLGVHPDVIADDAIGENLAGELIAYFGTKSNSENGSEEVGDAPKPQQDLRGKRFLLLRAEIARPILVRMLRSAGAEVDDVPVYQTRAPATLPAEAIEALRSGTVGWITFTSASTAKNLYAMLPEDLRVAVKTCKRLSIGPVTSKAMSDLGWPPTIEAQHHDIPGMVEALVMARSGT